MHENVFKRFPDADISALIVWIPILNNDSLAAAIPSAASLTDKRIHHFYDQHKKVGKIIADSVGWAGNIAWDIYLFYDPFTEWTDAPPKPKYWMHQLTDEWAKSDNYRTGEDLKNKLLSSTEKILKT